MDRYDEYTRKFMEEVSSGNPVITDKQRVGLGALGTILPKTKPLIRTINRLATSHGEEKTAASPNTVLHLYSLLNEKFGNDWKDWEPETLWKELGEEGILSTDEMRNVVGALQVVVNTYFPFEAWHIFENVAHAFAGNDVNFSIIQPLELTEVAAAIKILKEIRPDTEFELEVLDYIAAAAKNSGVVYLPSNIFPKLQDRLDLLNNDLPLKEKVSKIYPRVLDGSGPVEVQTQKLAEIQDYL